MTAAEADAALADLAARRRMVLAEHHRPAPEPRRSPIDLLLAVAALAVREIEEKRRRRILLTALGAVAAVRGCTSCDSRPRAAPRLRWTGQPGPLGADDEDDDVELADDDRARQGPSLRFAGCLPSLAISVLAIVARKRLFARLRARGWRRAGLVAGLIDALVLVPLTRRVLWLARTEVPDAGAWAADVTVAADDDPAPALNPLLLAPAPRALAGVLAGAERVDLAFLAERTPLDRVVLRRELGALERAGLVERERSGRIRRREWASLTRAGQQTVRAHAAALRAASR